MNPTDAHRASERAAKAEDAQPSKQKAEAGEASATRTAAPPKTIPVRAGPDDSLVQIPVWDGGELELNLVAIRNGELRARPTSVPGRVIVDATLPYVFTRADGLRPLGTPTKGLSVAPKTNSILAFSDGDFIDEGRLAWYFDRVTAEHETKPRSFTWSPGGWSRGGAPRFVRPQIAADPTWRVERTTSGETVRVELVKRASSRVRLELPGSPFPERKHPGITEISVELSVSGDTTWVHGGRTENDTAYLAAHKEDQLQSVPLEVNGQSLRGNVDAVAVGPTRELWLAVDGKLLVRAASGTLYAVPLPDPRGPLPTNMARLDDAAASEWLATEHEAQQEFEVETIARVDDEFWVTLRGGGPKHDASPRALYKTGPARPSSVMLPSVGQVHAKVERRSK